MDAGQNFEKRSQNITDIDRFGPLRPHAPPGHVPEVDRGVEARKGPDFPWGMVADEHCHIHVHDCRI